MLHHLRFKACFLYVLKLSTLRASLSNQRHSQISLSQRPRPVHGYQDQTLAPGFKGKHIQNYELAAIFIVTYAIIIRIKIWLWL